VEVSGQFYVPVALSPGKERNEQKFQEKITKYLGIEESE